MSDVTQGISLRVSSASRLFNKCESYTEWSHMTQPSDWSYFLKVVSYAQELLMPTALLTPPSWVNLWESRKAFSKMIAQILVFHSLQMSYKERALNVDIQKHRYQHPMASVLPKFPAMAHIANLFALETTDIQKPYSQFVDNAGDTFALMFQGISISIDLNTDTECILIADLTSIANDELGFLEPTSSTLHDIARVLSGENAAPSAQLAADANEASDYLAYLLNGWMLKRAPDKMFGPHATMQEAFDPATQGALAIGVRAAAMGKEIKWKFQTNTVVSSRATGTQPATSGPAYKYDYRDGKDPLIQAIMLAVSTKNPEFAKPGLITSIAIKEVTWLAYAFDKFAATGLLAALRNKDTINPVPLLKHYTVDSPSDLGIEYRIERKVNDTYYCDPSLFSLTDAAIEKFRALIPARSPKNCLFFENESVVPSGELIFTDADTGRSVYKRPADAALTYSAFFDHRVREIYGYTSLPANSLIKTQHAMPQTAVYDEKFTLPARSYWIVDRDGTVINYGPTSTQTGKMLDPYDELQTFCDLLVRVQEANDACKTASEVNGTICNNSSTSLEWYEQIWDYLKKHPIILLLIILLLIFLFMKYVLPSFNQGVKKT